MLFRFHVTFRTPTVMRRGHESTFVVPVIDGHVEMLSDGTGDDGNPTNGDAVYQYGGLRRADVLRSPSGNVDDRARYVNSQYERKVREIVRDVEMYARIGGGVSYVEVTNVTVSGPHPDDRPEHVDRATGARSAG